MHTNLKVHQWHHGARSLLPIAVAIIIVLVIVAAIARKVGEPEFRTILRVAHQSYGTFEFQQRWTYREGYEEVLRHNNSGSIDVYVIGRLGNPVTRHVEIRTTENGRGIWLVARDDHRVIATLDLEKNELLGLNGFPMDPRVPLERQEDEAQKHGQKQYPGWAKLNGGHLLGSARF